MDIHETGASFVVKPNSGGIIAMGWILWTILLSCCCIYIVFLVSCLRIAKEADEKFDLLGLFPNIKHERLKETTYVSMHGRFHTAKIAGSNPTSHVIEIETPAK